MEKRGSVLWEGEKDGSLDNWKERRGLKREEERERERERVLKSGCRRK